MEDTVAKVKIISFLISLGAFLLIYIPFPYYLTTFSYCVVMFWASHGYKRLYGGWLQVTNFQQSGRAFALALLWPAFVGKR